MRQLTRFQTGYSVNFGMISDPVFDAYYPKAVATTSLDGIKQILKDANLYVAQQHYTISLLQPMSFGFYQPWLHGYNAQFFGVSGPAIGALLLGYYPPRFWIDQNMKKTMGR
jgi:ABC-type transport system substrate-binding protein